MVFIKISLKLLSKIFDVNKSFFDIYFKDVSQCGGPL